MPAEKLEPAAMRAYHELERLIVTLELAPGSIATEGSLIELLSLGRTPVREAIQRLAWEGLVEIRPRAGLAIASLHAGDWLRVIDARRGVETLLARSAARFVTRDAVDHFHDAALAVQKAVIANDVQAFLAADKALDAALAVAADNQFASRLAAPLQAHGRRFWFRYRRETDLAALAEYRVALIRSVLDNDEDAAAADADRLMTMLRVHAEATATR
ncbi:GntR family transcriptional regulator [Aminobacter sp. MET-1]|uniref:GntR family transcriptional regulator n=1 Tax=Aminobacter sp. MET-1 TaxID=2951085 RepID=UPI00226AC041|nr:GntR family transcriptional regulator [Aminobacter sp. MET-1]MCX8567432.1 GntR family transcriptional regulator [Aminobacter sp. MET-1]